ncbi:MAG: prolyl oligopeptidase family serine peptidase [Bacteroidota bacterium]
MRFFKAILSLSLCLVLSPLAAQKPTYPQALSVQQIMQDPAWIGSSPSRVFWAEDGSQLFFNWNPENSPADSLYAWNQKSGEIAAVSLTDRRSMSSRFGTYNPDYSEKLFVKNGDIHLLDLAEGKERVLFQTVGRESNPQFSLGETHIVFEQEGNLFRWSRTDGSLEQLTNFRSGSARPKRGKGSPIDQKAWLEQEELSLIGVLAERKADREAREEAREAQQIERMKPYYYGVKSLDALQLSPDGRFATFRLEKNGSGVEYTSVPDYIRESAYTDDLRARPKVGSPQDTYELGIYNRALDTVYFVDPGNLPGIKTYPAYLADYDAIPDSAEAKARDVLIMGPRWSADGRHAVVEIRSLDFKDRWIATLDPNTGTLRVLDHQHDEAWIGGPEINRWLGYMGAGGWLSDHQTYWFQSEESGFSHLHGVNVISGEKQALTSGEFEVSDPQVSRDGKHFYFTSSEADLGQRHFYKMSVQGGKRTRLTAMEGRNQAFLSPDESQLAILNSTSTHPTELYLQNNKPKAKAKRLTESISEAFLSYEWREPDFVSFSAADGAEVPARLYRPAAGKANGAAVIFVHGAGYLQNAHKWWSSYFREYMFHNLLVERGYTVLDIDYRGSAGYGRDWRTGIYRHMGGKDLSDQVDGVKYLVQEFGVDEDRVGIYGGSYGGFITFMALFTEPGVFAAGAALRPVSDWAHYNHGYTAAILNTPQSDSIAYVRSSPIYHAEGLQDALLICHGMIDTNVHFQDVVRLTQRLIELGKTNWEVAMYPMEGHGFREPSSWTDEYRRILELFERELAE